MGNVQNVRVQYVENLVRGATRLVPVCGCRTFSLGIFGVSRPVNN